MTKKQFRQRLTDLYTGAYGQPPEPEGELIHGGGAKELEAFLRAILNTWNFRKDEAGQPYWFRVFWIDKLESIPKLSERLWDELVEEEEVK